MNYSLNFEKSRSQIKSSLFPPADLAGKVSSLKKIKRYHYKEYPEGIFKDDVEFHTYRVVLFARSLELPERSLAKLERILWVHDIPELIVGDLTIVEKDFDMSQSESDQFKYEEDKAAKNLLLEEDYLLWKEFDDASDYLSGDILDDSIILPEAFLAKVIDRIDVDVHFHYSLARYLEKKGLWGTPIPPEKAITRLHRTYPEYLKRSRSYRRLYGAEGVDLLRFARDEVSRIWSELYIDSIPKVLRQYTI